MNNKFFSLRLLILFSLVITVYIIYEATALNWKSQEIPAGQMQIHGQVTDGSGQPLPLTWIYITDDQYRPVAKTTTNQQGNYDIFLPAQPLYNVYVGIPGILNPYCSDYIPQSKTATLELDRETKVDFIMLAGATIELRAYNAKGDLIHTGQFLESTGNASYVNAPTNLPRFSSVAAIFSAVSRWQFDQATPSFIVIPGTEYDFHFIWKIPEFGKILITLDNAGGNYKVEKQSGKLILNFNYEAARSKLASVRRDAATMKEADSNIPDILLGEIDRAQSHLSLAEKYLEQQPFADMKNAVAELNQSLKYSFMVNEKLNLEQAKTDIEKYRKGSITIKLVDSNGLPVAGSAVVYRQTANNFLFGANPLGEDGNYDPKYVSLLKDAGINSTSITCRWGRLEPVPGIYDWNNIDSFQRLKEQTNGGFNLTGTLSMWLYRSASVEEDFCPQYFDTMDFNELKKIAYNHAAALSGRYVNKINTFEINELNLPWANALNLSLDSRIQLADAFSRGIRSSNPQGKIIFNSLALPFSTEFLYQNISQGEPFPYFLDMLKASKLPVDIIGLEFYYAGVNGENGAKVGLDMAMISDILDRYSSYNTPIYIEEISAPSSQLPGSYWWHRPWDEKTQAEYLEQFYTLAFSKPMVRAINWSWGVSDRESYIAYGGLLDTNLKPKQAYFALKQLLASWRTSGSGISDKQGELRFRGFAGAYNIEVTAQGKKTIKTMLHVTEAADKEIVIMVK